MTERYVGEKNNNNTRKINGETSGEEGGGWGRGGGGGRGTEGGRAREGRGPAESEIRGCESD